MDDEESVPSSTFFADTRPNKMTVSKTRPALDLDDLAEQIAGLESLPPNAARDRALRLWWSVGSRINDPWLKTRLLSLIYD